MPAWTLRARRTTWHTRYSAGRDDFEQYARWFDVPAWNHDVGVSGVLLVSGLAVQ